MNLLQFHSPKRQFRTHALRRRRPSRFPALLLILALCSVAVLAERRERLIQNWRPLHYDVTLVFNDKLDELTRAETRLDVLVLKDNLSVVDLDFGALTIDSLSVGTRTARYERQGERLNVSLARPARRGERLRLSIVYRGKPSDGLILTNDKDGRPSATGDNWPNRVHHWIPSLDHPSAKATVRFNVTAPKRATVVAGGRLDARRANMDATQTWTFTEGSPVPPYCMVVAVGEFATIQPGVMLPPRHVPVSYYVPPSEQKFAITGFGAAMPSLKYFSQTVAPFPYSKLAHIVGATRFGGMENSGAIIYSRTLFDPRENAPMSARFNVRKGLVELIAHETAHQWFGDAVTPATWADLWLSEGFATYYAGLFVEHAEGRDPFRDYMRRKAEDYLKYAATRRAPIHDRETEDLNALLNPNNYQKGAWVLHMLRAELGDAAFFRGVRAYNRAHLHRTATTEDLRVALERASGRNLREFFARWIYGSGHPRYEANWTWKEEPTRTNPRAGTLMITLEQTQEDDGGHFSNTVPVEIHTRAGTRRLKLTPKARKIASWSKLSDPPTEVRIDPDATILKELIVRP
ncbi:MAG TPA: M1 family metallopeptidase [Pyrinomonadaceae bacterium]|nr:M1 family metallopeptidase [Pyrinomonadaceae bacterium]